LSDLGEYRGKQELYTRQAPQKLKALREHAVIESSVSSNRIEGVIVEPARLKSVLNGPKPLFKDRDEEEVRGYREALDLIHNQRKSEPLTDQWILNIHKKVRGQIWDAGCYKTQDGDIIETYPNGEQRIRFKTLSASATPDAMAQLIRSWELCVKEETLHPLIALALFNLDFLCIHPFRDGNGRVSRLLLLRQCYDLGYDVGRYISLERVIEQNKDRYYETLEQCSQGWHEGKNDPWPYVGYLLYILKSAYKEFSERVGEFDAQRGSKTEIVLGAIQKMPNEFTLTQLCLACPGVSRDMVKLVLKNNKENGVQCVGRGPAALWIKNL
jgi:Fic family protein